MRFFCIFLAKNLVNSKKSSNFAAAFESKWLGGRVLPSWSFLSKVVSRSRAVVARQAHNLKVVGSIPSSATRESLRRLFFLLF